MIKAKNGYAAAVLLLLATALVLTAHLTQPLRLQQAQQAQWQLLQAMLPVAMQLVDSHFEIVKADTSSQVSADKVPFYYRISDGEKMLALIIPIRARGFVDQIESWIVLDPQGKVVKVHIVRHKESASLIGTHWDKHSAWLNAFTGRTLQDVDEIDQITQATISSRTVIQSVQQVLLFFQQQNTAEKANIVHE